MKPWTLAPMVGLLALAGAVGWHFAGDTGPTGPPATEAAGSSGTNVGSTLGAPTQPDTTASSSHPAGSSTTGTGRPADAHAPVRFDGHTEYVTTPGTSTLPPELRREDVEIDPQTGLMKVKRIPYAAPPVQQPTETLGPRELPPGAVEIDPQTGLMTLKRHEQ